MIRTFSLSDLGHLLDIERQSFPKSPYDASTFIALYYLYPETFWVRVDPSDPGGGILGYIVFSPDGHIISMAVLPDVRRKGIGKELLRKAMAYPNIKSLKLEVRKSNTGAQAFYLRMGFQIREAIPGYYGDEDAFIMLSPPLSC
jgi:[ribosomal protein S18]-alanine N-acetyltransferase